MRKARKRQLAKASTMVLKHIKNNLHFRWEKTYSAERNQELIGQLMSMGLLIELNF